MKLFPAQHPPTAILFDIDNTLYRDDAYADGQVDSLIERFAEHTQRTAESARRLIAETREALRHRHGRRPSLGLTMQELGISIRQSVAWREELIVPEEHLRPDPRLRDMLTVLSRDRPLAAVTNNPVSIGRRSLLALGIADCFSVLIGLDSTWHSKPDWEPFAAACVGLGAAVERLLMVGDRLDVDIMPVVERGGAGLLVASRAELLELDMLLKRGAFLGRSPDMDQAR